MVAIILLEDMQLYILLTDGCMFRRINHMDVQVPEQALVSDYL